MAKQYKLTNTFTKLTEDTGTIYNAGIDVVELVSDTNQTVNQGVRLISGQKQAFSGTVYARSVGDTATINVVDFREGNSGKGGALLPDGSTDAAISKISQIIIDCGDTSLIPTMISVGDTQYPTTICAMSTAQPATGTELWIETE